MKKLLIATSLLTLTTTSAFAAVSGTLLLKGSVGRVLSIAVTADTAVSSYLDLGTTKSNLKVATVNEQSNVVTGYNVKITSANKGKLKRTGGSETFSYQMTYADAAVSLVGATTGTTFVTPASSAGVNINKDVKISYTGIPAVSMIEGEYTDTVTFSIAAN